MKFSSFLKDKILQFALILFAIFTIEIFLLAYKLDNFIKLYIPVCIIAVYIISILIEYYIKNKYYSELFSKLDKLDKKYLISEVIKLPCFCEGKILKDVIEQTNKSMIENVNEYKYQHEEYKEYIELWIHEIKIPMSTSKLIIENNKSEVTKSIDDELEKIENYIEQALYYARSNTVEKDYYIKRCELKEIVSECIRKNKKELIGNKIAINIHDLDISVNTDSKWLVFILNQIVQNSIKYIGKNRENEIEIYSKKEKECIELYVADNGIGIKEGEVGRVFEKGFTGTNGRASNKKSTGIGLYLCKKLCDKLGISININSTLGNGCKVILTFPNDSYIDVV